MIGRYLLKINYEFQVEKSQLIAILRVLDAKELKILEQLGILRAWSPLFHNYIAQKSEEELNQIFKTAPSLPSRNFTPLGLGRFHQLNELTAHQIPVLSELIEYDTKSN